MFAYFATPFFHRIFTGFKITATLVYDADVVHQSRVGEHLNRTNYRRHVGLFVKPQCLLKRGEPLMFIKEGGALILN